MKINLTPFISNRDIFFSVKRRLEYLTKGVVYQQASSYLYTSVDWCCLIVLILN